MIKKIKLNEVECSLKLLEDNCAVSNSIIKTNTFYESDFLEQVSSFITPEDVVFDVGAHIGNHAVYFASICNARVYSFEPNPTSYNVLSENIKLNSLEDSVSVLNSALGAEERKVGLEAVHDTDIGTTRVSYSGENIHEMTSIDAYFKSNSMSSLAYIKIDVEGFEADVIKGAKETILKFMPIVSTEVSTIEDFHELAELMTAYGYLPKGVFNSTPTIIWEFDKERNSSLNSLTLNSCRRNIEITLLLNSEIVRRRSVQEACDKKILDKDEGIEKLQKRIDKMDLALNEKKEAIDLLLEKIKLKDIAFEEVSEKRRICLSVIEELKNK